MGRSQQTQTMVWQAIDITSVQKGTAFSKGACCLSTGGHQMLQQHRTPWLDCIAMPTLKACASTACLFQDKGLLALG